MPTSVSTPDNNCFADIRACRDDFVRAAAIRLLAQPLYPAGSLKPGMIPAQAGAYIFYQLGSDRPFHIGESMNLRQRIYQNHLRGQLKQSPLKRKVKRLTGLEGPELRAYIFEHFQVRFMPLALGRIEVEDYLNAKFGIVESRPNAKTDSEE